MNAAAYQALIDLEAEERRDAFQQAVQRLGTTVGNVEKDFWVCWVLGTLYHGVPAGGPRLLFKAGTSLSKAYNLIARFSEDIDVTVYREDLAHPVTAAEMAAMSGKKRDNKRDAIRSACAEYIQGPLNEALRARTEEATGHVGRVDVDTEDPDGQSLLVYYPSVEASDTTYVRPVVRIEAGAKSACDPSRAATIRPYVADEVRHLDFEVTGVTTIVPERTFWDKVIIAHGTRRHYEAKGELPGDGA